MRALSSRNFCFCRFSAAWRFDISSAVIVCTRIPLGSEGTLHRLRLAHSLLRPLLGPALALDLVQHVHADSGGASFGCAGAKDVVALGNMGPERDENEERFGGRFSKDVGLSGPRVPPCPPAPGYVERLCVARLQCPLRALCGSRRSQWSFTCPVQALVSLRDTD